MQITSAAALAQLSGAMGLPLSLTGAPSPSDAGPVRLPISAPYSGLVPKLLGYAYRCAAVPPMHLLSVWL